MKKWYIWLVLAALWIPAAVMNLSEGRSAGFFTNLVQIGLLSLAAPVQYFCDKKGDKGKKIFRVFSVCAVAFCAVYCIAALLLLRR